MYLHNNSELQVGIVWLDRNRFEREIVVGANIRSDGLKIAGPGAVESENFTGMTALPFDLKLLVPSALIGCWTVVAYLLVCAG